MTLLLVVHTTMINSFLLLGDKNDGSNNNYDIHIFGTHDRKINSNTDCCSLSYTNFTKKLTTNML